MKDEPESDGERKKVSSGILTFSSALKTTDIPQIVFIVDASHATCSRLFKCVFAKAKCTCSSVHSFSPSGLNPKARD